MVCFVLVPPISYILLTQMGSFLGAALVWFVLYMGYKEYKHVEKEESKRNDSMDKYREILRKNGYG